MITPADRSVPFTAHGTDALPPITTWLVSDRLGLSAAKVIEHIAKDDRQPALRALRDAHAGSPPAAPRDRCDHPAARSASPFDNAAAGLAGHRRDPRTRRELVLLQFRGGWPALDIPSHSVKETVVGLRHHHRAAYADETLGQTLKRLYHFTAELPALRRQAIHTG